MKIINRNETRSDSRCFGIGGRDRVLRVLSNLSTNFGSLVPVSIGICIGKNRVRWDSSLSDFLPIKIQDDPEAPSQPGQPEGPEAVAGGSPEVAGRFIELAADPMGGLLKYFIENNFEGYDIDLQSIPLKDGLISPSKGGVGFHQEFASGSEGEFPSGPVQIIVTSQDEKNCYLLTKRAIGREVAFSLYDFTETFSLLYRLAFENDTDRLTGLLSRMSFFGGGRDILADSGYGLVAYLDLDNLKRHNDNWGHNVGDNYIIALARRIERFFERIPPNRKAFGRLSGDEFAICLGGFTDGQTRDEAIEGLNEDEAFRLPNGTAVNLSFSTGVARYPEDSSSLEDLLVYSDFAMSMVKDLEKGGIRFFSKEEHDTYLDISNSNQQLGELIRTKDISFIYVPYINVANGTTAVFELFPVSSLKGLEDMEKIKIAAKHCHRTIEVDTVIFEAMKKEFAKLAKLQFPQVVTLGYIPQDFFYQNELGDMLQLSGYPSNRLCLCFDSEMRSHYDRMRAIDSAKQMQLRFGFKNFNPKTTADALSFNPHIVKLNKALSYTCSTDEVKAREVRELIKLAQEQGFSTAAHIEYQPDIEFFRGLQISLLGGEAIYGSITSDNIEEYAVKKMEF